METNTENHPEAEVIDLIAISDACRELVGWYDQQLAGDTPTIKDLEPVITRLQRLPTIPGRLGKDIDLVASGAASRPPGAVVGAIERLRLMANHNPNPPDQTADHEHRRAPVHAAPEPTRQGRLPGFERPDRGD